MSYNIEKRFIPSLPLQRKTINLYVIAHEAGNENNTGPDAFENEIRYMTNNWRNAFTSDWVGGGGRIAQLAPVGRVQWGAGPKANLYSYAHVELARTHDPEQFKKDYAAYIWLLRKRAKDAGIPYAFDGKGPGIKSHEWVSKNLGGTNHTDPFGYLASHGISRAQFKRDVETGVPFGGQIVQATKPAPSKPAAKPSAPSGNSIVDYLNAKEQDSSLAARKKLAEQYGIKGYTGTAAQNLQLLDKLKSGAKPAVKPAPKPSPAYKGNSVVDYLNSQGRDSSLSARKRLAEQYGIKNYTGTAAQNTQLLNKLQAGSVPKKKINTTSIVDYLKLTKQPSSFAHRKKLAAKHGIKNYKGTASQNKKLLDILNK